MAAFLGWSNLIKSATITANSATLPAANIAEDVGAPSVAWQTAAGVVTEAGGALLTATFAAASPVRAVSLHRSNLTAAASVVFRLYTTPGPTLVYTATVPGPAAGYGQVLHVLPSDVSANYLTVGITDASNPDGFINVPLVFCGAVWFPASGVSFSSTTGRDDSVAEVVTRGGQEYPTLEWQRRRWAVALDGVRASELWAKVGELDRSARVGGNVLFAPDHGSTNLKYEAVFGRCKGTDVSFPYGAADRRRWTATIAERL